MYLSTYDLYPIYEPAEGGYYYEGRRLAEVKRLKHGKAKRELQKLERQLREEYDGRRIRTANGRLPSVHHVIAYGNCIEVVGSYVGEGALYVIESKNHIGKKESGWKPYC